MNDPDQPNLRELLHAELRADEDRAPDFDTVWSAAATRQHRRRTRSYLMRTSALAAGIACAFLALHTFRSAKNPRSAAPGDLPWRTAVLLTEWHSPTDTLLPVSEPFPLQP